MFLLVPRLILCVRSLAHSSLWKLNKIKSALVVQLFSCVRIYSLNMLADTFIYYIQQRTLNYFYEQLYSKSFLQLKYNITFE